MQAPVPDLSRIARRRANAKLGFLVHLLVYTLVNLLLFAINQQSGSELRWHVFPLGGWGLGLAMHGLAVFLAPWLFALRDRMAEDELRRLKSRQPEAGDPPR